ncbi:MAG TPA: tRNA dihydrouridine synthase DusB [Chthoniobacterales bacterium]
MLPWFTPGRFPLYLAPMAGVSDKIFRQLCKERGADVLVTEFVSAEGVFRRNARTRGYLEFDPIERPLGVQLFGGNAEHMAEAARQVVDWVQPDFIDLNFGCPVNKVVAKNGGSALLKDCPTLGKVAEAVVQAVAPLPVTAKIRTGWDDATVNAVQVSQLLESLGIAAVAVHGRTRAQGYSGSADWEVIAAVASAVTIPVIGNGDLFSAADVAQRRRETGIAGAMIGRAAMNSPWIFSRTKHYLATGELLPPPEPAEKWALIQRHCQLAVEECGIEDLAMRSMRGRLMAYSKGMPASKMLREKFQHVSSLGEVAEIAQAHLSMCKEAETPVA